MLMAIFESLRVGLKVWQVAKLKQVAKSVSLKDLVRTSPGDLVPALPLLLPL